MEPLQYHDVTSSEEIEEQRRTYWRGVDAQLEAEESELRAQIEHAEERNRLHMELIQLEVQDMRLLLQHESAYADNLSRLSAVLAADTARELRRVDRTSKEMKKMVAELTRRREVLRMYEELRTASATPSASTAPSAASAEEQHLSLLLEESGLLLRGRSEHS